MIQESCATRLLLNASTGWRWSLYLVGSSGRKGIRSSWETVHVQSSLTYPNPTRLGNSLKTLLEFLIGSACAEPKTWVLLQSCQWYSWPASLKPYLPQLCTTGRRTWLKSVKPHNHMFVHIVHAPEQTHNTKKLCMDARLACSNFANADNHGILPWIGDELLSQSSKSMMVTNRHSNFGQDSLQHICWTSRKPKKLYYENLYGCVQVSVPK